jgi:hypothetical protein
MSALKLIELVLVIFGPAVIFGVVAMLASRKKRGLAFWPLLAALLAFLHFGIMVTVRLA